IRDPHAPRKPDGHYPFSLARTQMAFWFFLVFTTYFFIWIVTGDKGAIPASILGLVGISAVTTVGATAVDSSRRAVGGPQPASPTIDPSVSRSRAIAATNEAIGDLSKKNDPSGHDQDAQQKAGNEQQNSQTPWHTFLTDILAESDTISIHRFQMFVWTLILGI